MPKMKTKRAAKKRYSVTGGGKVKIKKSGLRHNLGKHNGEYNRTKRKCSYVHQSDMPLVKRCLPYQL